MSIAYHGNYCGPGWSAGAYQSSVNSNVPATDLFDSTCKTHDAVYATGGDLASADIAFASANLTSINPKRWVAGAAVGLQGLARHAGLIQRYGRGSDDNLQTTTTLQPNQRLPTTTNMTRKGPKPVLAPLTKKEKANISRIKADFAKLQNRGPPMNLKQKSRYLPPIKPSMSIATPPVSIGTTVTSTQPTTMPTPDGVMLRHREFLCQVYETNNSSFQLSAAAPLHPAYYPASAMGQFARAYQRYRFRRIAIHFVTRQPTSVTGEIALVYASQVTEPAENGASATFLPRVMTRGDALMGPLWQNHTLEIPCDSTFRLIDPLISPDVAEHIFGEVQAYTLSGVTDTAGYLLIDYDLEFKTTMFAPHSALFPVSTGPGASFVLADSSTTPTAGNAVALTNAAITGSANGTVWKCYLNLDESTLATGTTAANAWNSTVTTPSTLSTYNNNTVSLGLVDGLVFYLVVNGSTLYAYTTLNGAIDGFGSGTIYYRTTGSSAASLQVNAYVIQYCPTTVAETS